MSVKISELQAITLANLLVTANTAIPVVSDVSGSKVTYQASAANIKSYVSSNPSITGTLGVSGIATFQSNVVVLGNLSVQGTTTTTSSQNLSTNASLIEMHTVDANLNPWGSNDGRDIGLRMFYYDTAANTAALYRESSNGFLTWAGAGAGNASGNISTSATFGTMQLGAMWVANTTTTTGARTGALQVNGGAYIGGNIWTDSSITAGGNYSSTSGNITAGNLSIAATAVIGSTLTTNGLLVNNSGTFGTTLLVTGTLTTNGILPSGNANANIGSDTFQYNTVFAKATSAQYADLAEKYLADANYEPGTVVVFGGTQEITVTTNYADNRVAGVVSTDPAYLMNSQSDGLPIALRGKVPVKVVGAVSKGDLLVTSTEPGYAVSLGFNQPQPYTVVAKALETSNLTEARTIIAVIL